jgi:hypothetical protein
MDRTFWILFYVIFVRKYYPLPASPKFPIPEFWGGEVLMRLKTAHFTQSASPFPHFPGLENGGRRGMGVEIIVYALR